MNLKHFCILLSVATVFSINVVVTKALAQKKPRIQFEKAIASGCKIANRPIGKDGKTSLFLFWNIQARDGQRKFCNIRINTTVPSGFRVENLQFLYQGNINVSSGSRGTSLSRSYTFAGGALGITALKPKISKFTSTNELFQELDDITTVSASCGGQGQLGINAIAQSFPGSSIVVDTPIVIHYKLAPC